jgi:DNA-binding MarR family transcriptional regulator
MNESAPTRVDNTLDWLHEQGKRRSEAVPDLDVEETLRMVRAASQLPTSWRDQEQPAGKSPAGSPPPSERSTRGQVARLILELGPSTAATLGGRLGLTPAGIRRHLENLIAEGTVESRTVRAYGSGGRGRPATVFVITDAGRSAFEHDEDGLATNALRFIEKRMGPEALAEFARQQVSELERRYAAVLAKHGVTAPPQTMAEAVSTDGSATAVALPANLEPVVASLQPFDNAEVRVGALMIVKANGVVEVFQLTLPEQAVLDHNP